MDIEEAFRTINAQVSDGDVDACFYPYKELKHTWRARNGRLAFRISDYMRGSPDDVLESAAWFLTCRARGEECPKSFSSRYLEHVRSAEFWSNCRPLYISRARNLSFKPIGNARDLNAAFESVRLCHFRGGLEKPDLAWARESPSRRIAFLHQPLKVLAVNRTLDSEMIPTFVLEFVIYHELLHAVMGCQAYPDRRVYHTNEFRARERQFAKHDEARRWLARIAVASEGGASLKGVVPQV
ncbi:MAG: hypothetical protein JSU93_00530 [Methanobacteriota archaeon]|nr:MAG: hypothetical protein JSU93_00530 [Euryarchaeota archaeon]